MREILDSHLVNHAWIVIDESGSMSRHEQTVPQVVDGIVRDLAADSQQYGQETRLSVYAFNSRGTERCLISDMDVLRMPSIAGLYHPGGLTALVDATVLAIDDMREVLQKYGDHAFLGYVISDGRENDSRFSPSALSFRLGSTRDNETVGAFVPSEQDARYARECGFPEGSVEIWNPNGHNAVQGVGSKIRETNRSFFEGRSQGVRAARSGMFTPGSFSAADVKAQLTPITPGAYGVYDVAHDEQIDIFIGHATRRPYRKGTVYYQLTKPVNVQDYKDVLIEADGQVYSGPLDKARALLGLPDHAEKVSPRDLQTGGCTVFIQSTSYNRKLLAGTRVVVLR